MNIIDIIGIGQGAGDLTALHMEKIQACDLLVGGKRHLALFEDLSKETIPITRDIKELTLRLKSLMAQKKIVVLASGDPLYYGIGATLAREIDPDRLCFHANITSIAAAFAIIKTPWHDARIISLHGAGQEAFSFATLISEHKVAFLTDLKKDPCYIAENLMKEGLLDFKFWVLEQIGDPENQKTTCFSSPQQVLAQSFSHPNIVVLQRSSRNSKIVSHETHIGMPEKMFRHSKGLITKSEVRAVSLSKLKLMRNDHVLWDIGAGSGAVSIEASCLLPQGHVFAFEKNSSRIPDIIHNISNFERANIKVLNTSFPEGIDDIRRPDRIFIGGGGSALESIIQAALEHLDPFGSIVINTVLIENLHTAIRILKQFHIDPEIVQMQISRSKPMPFSERMEALNPVWIISGNKNKKSLPDSGVKTESTEKT